MSNISLAEVPRRLRDLGVDIGYRRLHGRVLDGDVPAVRRNGRWYIDESKLPVIAETLGASAASASAQS